MTSYEANFESNHTRDGSSSHTAALENTTKCPITFYLLHTTIPNYNLVTRLLEHTFSGNFDSFYEVNSKFKHFLFFYTKPYKKKGNQAAWQNRANPLYYMEGKDAVCNPLCHYFE